MHICTSEGSLGHRCGCVTKICDTCGVQFSWHKCEAHRAVDARERGPEYFTRDLCSFTEEGWLDNEVVCRELSHALDELHFWPAFGPQRVLELGCGLGRYVPLFHSWGARYIGVEINQWAAEFTRRAHLVPVFDEMPETGEFNVIFSSHVIEHLADAKGWIREAYNRLVSHGTFIAIVPNDRDPLNPDHLWFFTQPSVEYWLREAGFRGVVSILVERPDKNEDFIYVIGRKV